MAKELGSETIDSISAAAAADQGQIQLHLDDSQTPVLYSSTSRVLPTAEEINLDFASAMRQTGPNSARLKIDQRVVLSPWGAKRLALALNQAIAAYERTYGVLETDARKRIINQPVGQTVGFGKPA